MDGYDLFKLSVQYQRPDEKRASFYRLPGQARHDAIYHWDSRIIRHGYLDRYQCLFIGIISVGVCAGLSFQALYTLF